MGIYRYSTFDLNYIFFHEVYIYIHIISFAEIFYYAFPVIILKTCIFKFSVLFGTHTLLDKLLRVLQLPTHLSNLTANG